MSLASPSVPSRTTSPSAPERSSGLSPALLLRFEGLALLAISVFGYARLGVGWWLFAALFLVPDLGLVGYAAGPRVGARTYNLLHTLSLPALLGGIGLATGAQTVLAIALVWAAHIGMDRAAGYGLKYPTRLGDTHLQRTA